MATAKKAAGKTAKASAGKNSAAADVDDILGGKAAPAAKGKAAKGKAAKAAPAAKKAAATRAASGSSEEVRAVLAKTKKSTSYNDIAEANGFNIRMVRRTARSMRDAGEIDLVKEGTIVYVKPAGKGK
jgi:hypothetical protein